MPPNVETAVLPLKDFLTRSGTLTIVVGSDDPVLEPHWAHRRRLQVVADWIERPRVTELPDGSGFVVRVTLVSPEGLSKRRYVVDPAGAVEGQGEAEAFDLDEVGRLARNQGFERYEEGRFAEAEAALGPAIEIMDAMRLDGVLESSLLLRSSLALLGGCLRARGDHAGMVACFVRRARCWRSDPGSALRTWAPTLFATQVDPMNRATFGAEAVTALPPDWLGSQWAGVRVNQIVLPFYPGAVLWQAFDREGEDPEWILDGGGDLWSLGIDEDLILEANAKIPIQLTADTVIPYLKFYGTFAWFYHGPSYVVENRDHPAWATVTDPVDPGALARLGPPRLLEPPEPGVFLVESSVVESRLNLRKGVGALLETYTQTVTLDGTVEDWA